MTTVKEHFYTFSSCDGCSKARRVRRLPTSLPDENGSTSAAILCQQCWEYETAWRRAMNEKRVASPWPLYGFYTPSPDGIGEFEPEGMQKMYPPDVVDFDDLGLTASLVPLDPDNKNDSRYAYAIMDEDGNTIDWADNIGQLQEYVDKRRLFANLSQKPELDMGDLVGNPRVVFLWDRVNGMTVVDEYVAYIVWRALIKRKADTIVLYGQKPNPVELVAEAIQHAEGSGTNRDYEWVVVALPVGREHNERQNLGETVEKKYARMLGALVLDANIREMVDRAREPQ